MNKYIRLNCELLNMGIYTYILLFVNRVLHDLCNIKKLHIDIHIYIRNCFSTSININIQN